MSETTYTVGLLRGDGIGPEVIEQSVGVLDTVASCSGFTIKYNEVAIGGVAVDQHGVPVRDEDIEMIRAGDAALLGAVGGPKWENIAPEIRPEAGLLKLRQQLGLFANLRPVKVFPALVDASPLKSEIAQDVDLLIVRELTGGIYFGKPSGRTDDDDGRSAVDTLPYTEHEIARLVELGFELAAGRRGKVSSVDKSNVMATSRLWREVTNEIGARHPDIELEHVLVDACAMRLISRPRDFDVMVMENMFGDILSDEAAVLAGSLGMLPSASLSAADEGATTQFGLYEPIHGSAPDITGKNMANPCGAILSAAMMLRTSLGRDAEAAAIETAVETVLNDGGRTADIAAGGTHVTTSEFGALVIEALRDNVTS